MDFYGNSYPAPQSLVVETTATAAAAATTTNATNVTNATDAAAICTTSIKSVLI